MRLFSREFVRTGGPSLRVRMAIGTALIALLVQVAVQLFSDHFVTAELDSLFSWRFETRGDTLERIIAAQDGGLDDESLIRESSGFFLTGKESWLAAIYRPNGELVSATSRPAPSLASMGFTPSQAGISAPPLRTTVRLRDVFPGSAFGPWARVHLRTIPTRSGQPLILLMAASDARFQHIVEYRSWVFFLGLGSAVLATGLAAWWLSGYAVAPLLRMRRVTSAFSPASIRDDLPPAGGLPVEMQEFERELMSVRDQLREFMLAQDRLLANISHEVNTPIAILLTEAQTLDQRCLPPSGTQFVSSVQAEMRRLRRTVESFLLLTKLRTGKQIVRPRALHVNDVVVDAVAAVTPAASAAGVNFRVELEPDTAPIVDGDLDLVRVMLENLLQNAVRYAGPSREVGICTKASPGQCTITITDGGEHMLPEELLQAFNRYTTPTDGSVRNPGLGLAIAQGLAELHKGRITAANRPKGGCEYRVVLPLHAPEDDGLGERAPRRWFGTGSLASK